MAKAVSFSLFGWDKEQYKNCFDFAGYCRGLHYNIRLNRIIYPNWVNALNIDESTYNSPYKKVFDWYQNKGFVKIKLFPDGEPLCRAMLRRLETVFSYSHPTWDYSHVICRDLDSIPTYREALMVQEWIKEDKAMHCITDSVSHTIPAMGGMIGLRPGYLRDIMKISAAPPDTWNMLLSLAPDINYNIKGSDQDFLGRIIYPRLCTSSTEHFIKGRPHDLVEGNGRHYNVPNTELENVDKKFEVINECCGHIGSAGAYETQLMRFLNRVDPYKDDYEEIEGMPGFEKLFFWFYREDLKQL